MAIDPDVAVLLDEIRADNDALRLRVEELENVPPATPPPAEDQLPTSILIQLPDGTLLTYLKEEGA